MPMRVCMHAFMYSCMNASRNACMDACMSVHVCMHSNQVSIKQRFCGQSSSHHMPMSHHAWCSGAVFWKHSSSSHCSEDPKQIQGLKALKCKNFTRLRSCQDYHCSNEGQSQSKFIHTKRQIYTNLMILRSTKQLIPWALIAQSQNQYPSPCALSMLLAGWKFVIRTASSDRSEAISSRMFHKGWSIRVFTWSRI